MDRESWLRRCAQRIMDKSDCDAGSAAAYAKECARIQQAANGSNVARWIKPEDEADEEMKSWDSEY